MKKIYACGLLMASLFGGMQHLEAQTISGLSAATYTEGTSPIIVQPNVTVTGGSGFGGGYLLFKITNPAAADQLRLSGDANPNAAGAISVDAGAIYLGNGTTKTLVGSVDGILNGQNGKDLKINFTSNFSNSSFESGFDGWTVGNQMIDLGVSSIAGFVTPNDPTPGGGDSDVPQFVTYNNELSTTQFTNGAKSLRLYSDMTTRFGCDIVHGPFVYSAPFQSNAGDVLSFDWRAFAGSDAYDVFGYMLNTTTGATTIVLNQTGSTSSNTNWATASVTVPTTGSYRFVFVSGTFDATCGLAAGASLYIDNVRVFGDNVNASVITSIAQKVTYQNTCGTSTATKNLQISIVKTDNTTTSANSTIALNTIAPIANSKNITVYLNAAGQATIAENAVNNGSTDNCAITFNTDINNFNCSNLGNNPVVLSVTDSYGNTSTSNAVVTVLDNIAPIVPVLADVKGQCSATATAPTTTDNCKGTITGTTTDPVTYATQGTHIITWSFNDGNGNTSTATQKVIIKDLTAPVPVLATLPDVISECSASVTSTPTATDNCNGTIVGTTNSPLTYSGQGNHDIIWTFNDGNGNISTQVQTVKLKDTQAPSLTATGTQVVNIPAGYSANWNMYQYNFADPLPAGSIVTGITLSYSGHDQGWGGTGFWTGMIVSGTNIGGNQLFGGNQNFTLNYNGSVPAYAYGGTNYMRMDFPTYPGWVAYFNGGTMTIHYQTTATAAPAIYAECSATVATAPTAADNCAGMVTGTTNDPLTYSTQGTHTINWTFNDGNGNISTATQDVVIKDITKPSITAPATVNAVTDNGSCSATNVSLGNATATDNCNIATVTNNAPSSYPVGSTIVTWTATDIAGNTETATQTVIVTDNQAPTFAAISNISVNTDANVCGAKVTYVTPVGTDNCAVTTVQTAGLASGSIFPVGTTTNTFVATDASNNSTSISFDVTVTDNEAPVALTKNATVQLDALGNGSITASEVNNGSSDACGIASVTVSPSTFTCSNVGANTVTLTVTDNNGNVSTATATVTVEDNIAPIALAKNISVTLANGIATITPASVNNGSSDACGIATMAVSKTSFDCSNLGSNPVTLTVTDNHGNVSRANASVTVIGAIPAPAIAVSRSNTTFTGNGMQQTIVLGYGTQNLTLTASNASSAPAASSYVWSGTASAQLSSLNVANPVFTPTTAGTYTFTVMATNEFGCKKAAQVTLSVIEARCGNKNDKVLICHNGNEICVAPSAIPAHLAHGGDYLGGCGSNTRTASAEKVKEETTFVAFPNPFTTSTNLEFTLASEGKFQVELIDMKGSLISVIAQGEGQLNKQYSYQVAADKLATGMYIIRLVSANEVKHLKIMLEK